MDTEGDFRVFEFKGRLRRSDYVLNLVVLGGFTLLFASVTLQILWVLVPILLCFGVALTAQVTRRLHDLDRSGLESILLLVPGANAALIVLLGFPPGTKGENRFGDDPRRSPSPPRTRTAADVSVPRADTDPRTPQAAKSRATPTRSTRPLIAMLINGVVSFAIVTGLVGVVLYAINSGETPMDEGLRGILLLAYVIGGLASAGGAGRFATATWGRDLDNRSVLVAIVAIVAMEVALWATTAPVESALRSALDLSPYALPNEYFLYALIGGVMCSSGAVVGWQGIEQRDVR